MAIDFSQVKTITIPEGSVTKITDSNGNTLWQGVGWHTIWEGNKICSVKLNNTSSSVISGNEENFAQTAIGTGYSPKIRITFSYSITNHTSSLVDSFYLNDSRSNTFPSSPVTIEAVEEGNNIYLLGPCVSPSNFAAYARVLLLSNKDINNNRITFDLLARDYYLGGGNYGAYFTITLNITKIEQYY